MARIANFAKPNAAINGVVSIPALGLSVHTVICFAAGLAFAGFGAGFEIVLQSRNLGKDAPAWFFHGILGVFIAGGAMGVAYAALEIVRRFEFRADDINLERTTIIGPFRSVRQLKRGDIRGVTLRLWQYHTSDDWSSSRLMLVMTDDRLVLLIPPRPTSFLVPIEHQIKQLLFPNAAHSSDLEMPLGGGLEEAESHGGMRITAKPIPPIMVSQNLYTTAGAFMYGDPIFSVLATIALWQTIRHNQFEPFFWYAMIGQLLGLTIGGWFVRRWIRNIAARRYEITLDRSTINVVQISGANVATRQCHISEVREIRSTAVVSEGERRKIIPKSCGSIWSWTPANR